MEVGGRLPLALALALDFGCTTINTVVGVVGGGGGLRRQRRILDFGLDFGSMAAEMENGGKDTYRNYRVYGRSLYVEKTKDLVQAIQIREMFSFDFEVARLQPNAVCRKTRRT